MNGHLQGPFPLKRCNTVHCSWVPLAFRPLHGWKWVFVVGQSAVEWTVSFGQADNRKGLYCSVCTCSNLATGCHPFLVTDLCSSARCRGLMMNDSTVIHDVRPFGGRALSPLRPYTTFPSGDHANHPVISLCHKGQRSPPPTLK